MCDSQTVTLKNKFFLAAQSMLLQHGKRNHVNCECEFAFCIECNAICVLKNNAENPLSTPQKEKRPFFRMLYFKIVL